MKKYIIFAGDHYSPNCGMSDLLDVSFDSMEQCEKYIENNAEHDWHQIVDKDSWLIVKEVGP